MIVAPDLAVRIEGELVPCRTLTVWCDGARLDKCFYADSDAGVAQCRAVDERGRCYIDPNDRTKAAEVTHRGIIEIKLHDLVVAKTHKPVDIMAITRSFA